MNHLTINRSRPRVVVGLDFGTTFSGFAYALTAHPEKILRFYQWKDLGLAGGGHYCKTMTSLLYQFEERSSSYILIDWGYSALLKHLRGFRSRRPEQISFKDNTLSVTSQLPPVSTQEPEPKSPFYFATLFKLHLVGSEAGRTSAANLPEGLTVRRLISDYLRKLSECIMTEVQGTMGNHITMEDVQWCLTVPAIWDDRSKQEMKICASMAGLTKGPDCPPELAETGSPHPLLLAIEPEAASFYCQSRALPRDRTVALDSGDKFLIVDVGGGTVDLVLHQKVGTGLKVREVSPSSGGLFGGSFVDKAFFEFLRHKISCFEEFARTNSDTVLKLKGWWETIKYGFDGSMTFPYDLELPARLASAWQTSDQNRSCSDTGGSYDAIELSLEDMKNIFDPVVDEIIKLIEEKIVNQDLRAMMIVGGFSGSPYLIQRIKHEFSERVGAIVVPKEPGAAICCGAAIFGLYGADLVCSRRSKKTYGIAISRPFYFTDPHHLMYQDEDGEACCSDVFSVYTKFNDEVPLDHRVSRKGYPAGRSQTQISICLYSTEDSNPQYVCDAGVTKEGTFYVTCPSEEELGEKPEVLISLYFGRTSIEVEAEGQNFGNGEKFKLAAPVTFEKSLE